MSATTPTSRPPFLRSLSSASSLKPAKDKPRLYIVLYPRGGSSPTSTFRNNLSCDAYHWSVVVGPQTSGRSDPGIRYHSAHLDHEPTKFVFEEQDVPSNPSAQTGLVRITVAKVINEARLHSILRDIPIPQNDTAFNCLTWVRDAFIKLHEDGKSVKSYLAAEDWNRVETCARAYYKRKRDIRRWEEDRVPRGLWNMDRISTFNFWENRETTP